MFTPSIIILAYLLSVFALGLALGWLLWKFGLSEKLGTLSTEMLFWKQRWDQARLEHDRDQDKIASLEEERDKLKKSLEASAS
jgi:hypothetical protein